MKHLAIILLIMLTACTTPKTVLKNPRNGQVAVCGGSANASLAGGVIGYHIEKGNDERCVNDYHNQGFKTLSTEN